MRSFSMRSQSMRSTNISIDEQVTKNKLKEKFMDIAE